MDIKKGPDEYCRICASGGQLLSIFDMKNGTHLLELISKHLDLLISETDGLSSRICEGCVEKLLAFHDYFEMCGKVQDMIYKWKFKESFSKIEVTMEAVEDTHMVDSNVKNEVKIETKSIIHQFDISMSDSGENINPMTNISCEENDTTYFQFDNSTLIETDHNSDSEEDLPLSDVKKSETRRRKRKPGKYGVLCENISFQCHICKENCESWYLLTKHTKRKHKTYAIAKCTMCNVNLKSRTTLYIHVKNHKNPTSYPCDKCPTISKSSEAMEKHKLRHIPKNERKRIYKCEKCPKIFNTKDHIKTHQIVHIPIEERKKYPCSICDLKFTTLQSVNIHVKNVHYRIKTCMCDLCGYTCGTPHELKQHKATHSSERPHVCAVCSKGFKTDTNLKVHMDTHSAVTYTCDICNKVLNSRKTYLRHRRYVHTDQRDHVCGYCSIGFKRKETLRAHMNSHTGVKPIECKWCKERFMYWAGYRTHKLRHHPEILNSKQSDAKKIDTQLHGEIFD